MEDTGEDYAVADFVGVREPRVAWFVSNCNADNKRLEYARSLSRHYPVDIFGKCGELKCSRSSQSKCWEMVAKKYKYYLAFENSNCVDYITEKFWDALKHKVEQNEHILYNSFANSSTYMYGLVLKHETKYIHVQYLQGYEVFSEESPAFP